MMKALNVFAMCRRDYRFGDDDKALSTDRLTDIISSRIDHQIQQDKAIMQKTFKILLLGAAASGKSTVFKQIILHLNGFEAAECSQYRHVIRRNLYDALHEALSMAEQELNFVFDDEYQEYCQIFYEFRDLSYDEMMTLTIPTIEAICKLCKSKEVNQLLLMKNTLPISDSCQYFLNNADRILHKDYANSVEDILRMRVPTVGIREMDFPYKDKIMCMLDVGGQKTEQRKWIRCFDNVAGVLFILDLSAYNMKMEEGDISKYEVSSVPDKQGAASFKSALKNSFYLFRDTVSNGSFSLRTAFIVFFNKNDIFTEKLTQEKIPLSRYFSKYKGDNSYKNAITFLIEYLEAMAPPQLIREKRIYTHVTTATDTENIRVVFEDCTEAVLRANLATAGYV